MQMYKLAKLLSESSNKIIKMNPWTKRKSRARTLSSRTSLRVKIFQKWISRHHLTIKFELHFYDLNLFIIYCRDGSLYYRNVMFHWTEINFVNKNFERICCVSITVRAVCSLAEVRKLFLLSGGGVGWEMHLYMRCSQLIQQWIFNVIVVYRSMTPPHINWSFS